RRKDRRRNGQRGCTCKINVPTALFPAPSRCYASSLNSTSAASRASSLAHYRHQAAHFGDCIQQRPLGVRKIERTRMAAVGRKCSTEGHKRLSAYPAERCCRRGNDLLGKRLHITLNL